MAKCINTSHPDFKKLEQDSGIDFLDLEIMVSDWQSARNTDEFPTVDQISTFYELASEPKENVDQKVKEELLAILNRNGITVTSMSEYEENYPLRTGKPFTVRALADTLRNIIAVDESLESNRTLSEEAMHMAVAANVGTFEFNRAMRLVADTTEYTENYNKYEQAYKAQGLTGDALERKIRMEILGKLGKELLFQEVKSSTQGSGIGKYLRRMWKKFLDLFRPAKTELEKVLAKWSDQLISGNIGQVSNQGTFFTGQALTEAVDATSILKAIKNTDGSRKRYIKYEQAKEAALAINRTIDTDKYAVQVIKVTGEKGDSRVYHALKLVTKSPNLYFTVSSLTNKDGSKRLAQTDGENVFITKDISVNEFYEYITGGTLSESSKQKQAVLEIMKSQYGISLEDIQALVTDEHAIKSFIFYHEKSHVENNDKHVYWKQGRDLLTKDKLEIEARANYDAYNMVKAQKASQSTFFELEDTPISEAEKLYKKFLEGLKSRALTFQRFGGESKAASERLLERYYEFYNKEFNAGLVDFVNLMVKDINNTAAFIKKYEDGSLPFTSREWRDMKIMLDYYDPHRKQLEDYMVKSLKEDGVLNDEQIKEIEEGLDTVLTGLNKIKGLHRRAGLKLTEEHVIAEVKDAISDPVLQKQEIESLTRHLREVDFDSNRALYWAGSLVHAKDEFLRNVHYTMTKVRRSVDRFTYDLGKRLTKEAERLGVKDTSKFIEKIDGKFSHYFIDRFRYGAFTQASVEFHKQRHVKYGLPEDKIERRAIKNTWREASIAVAEGTATQEQEELADILTEYNKEVAQWFSENTVPKPNWQQIVEQVKKELGGGTTPEFQEWKEENIGISQPGTKWESEYPKGVLVEPSDGRVITRKRGGKEYTAKTKDWRNPEFAKLTSNEREYLEILLNTMEEADTKHNRTRHRLQLPQIKASTVDLLKSKKFSNIVENIKDIARTTKDDTEFGEEGIMRPDGTVANFVPVYFINRLDNADQISQDLTSSVLAYADVMENFKQMTRQAPMFEMILDVIGDRQVKTGKKAFTGLESETYKSMKNFLEMNLYGKWKEQWIVGGVNITKLMQGLTKYVTTNNLAFSLYTTLASYFTSATYSKIEDLVGQFTTQQDKLFAEKVWDTNIHQVLLESGKVNKTSKLGLFFEHHRILDKNRNIFDNLDKSRFTRQAVKSGLFWSYDLVRLRIRGKLALAIASNYRYHNGKFKTRQELKNLGVKDIDKLPTYYDMTEVKDGRLVAKHADPKIEDIIERRVEFIGSNIDGELNYSDWAAAHRGALTQLVTTHRGWLFRNIQLRLKPKGVNYQTGEMDEGWYLTTFDFVRKTFLGKEKVTNLKALLTRWGTLDAYQKQGVLRTLWETAFIFAVSSLAMILNNLALDSDEDDDLIQYLAYQSNRVLLELGVMNPSLVIAVDPFTDHPDGNNIAWRMPLAANIQELVAILNSPVAATRQLDDLMDLTHIFSSEEIESGPYEGMTKFNRLLIKMGPGTKGIYQARDPKSRNQFLRNRTLNWMYQ